MTNFLDTLTFEVIILNELNGLINMQHSSVAVLTTLLKLNQNLHFLMSRYIDQLYNFDSKSNIHYKNI